MPGCSSKSLSVARVTHTPRTGPVSQDKSGKCHTGRESIGLFIRRSHNTSDQGWTIQPGIVIPQAHRDNPRSTGVILYRATRRKNPAVIRDEHAGMEGVGLEEYPGDGVAWSHLRLSGEENGSGPFPLCLCFYKVLLQKHKISSDI